MLTYSSVVRASVEGLAGRLIGRSFFLARRHFFSVWTGCVFGRKPFLVSISGRPLVSSGEAKKWLHF